MSSYLGPLGAALGKGAFVDPGFLGKSPAWEVLSIVLGSVSVAPATLAKLITALLWPP